MQKGIQVERKTMESSLSNHTGLNDPHASHKAVGEELKIRKLLPSEASKELTRCQEEHSDLHSELETMRARKSTAEENLGQLTKDCDKLTEDCNVKFKEGYGETWPLPSRLTIILISVRILALRLMHY
jgi:hypothetical protein